MKITNNHNISLPLAVWLLHDDYDHVSDPKYFSATGLLKSTKQSTLSKRVDSSNVDLDVADFIASRVGTAIHDSVEHAWTRQEVRSTILRRLGYPLEVIDRIRVNPTAEEIRQKNDIIPIYIEQRAIREIDGFKVGGKYDFVAEGRLFDFKTTSVYSYIKGSKDEDYALQGGIYRWLNPTLITDDHIYIQFIFTDWQKSMINSPGYPQSKIVEYPVKMPSLEDTERYIRAKLRELARASASPEEQMPACTDKELWRSEPVFKYYADPTKTTKSTKNFDNLAEANQHQKNAGKGIVITKPGEVKACGYCRAYSICKQKDQYFNE